MLFKPAESSKKIKEFYKRYLLTTFKTNNPIYNKQLEEELDKPDAIAKGPYINMNDPYAKGQSIEDLINDNILAKSFMKLSKLKPQRKLYKHQVEAITKAHQNKNLVITTGTGSGKTECFLIPVINQLLKEQEAGTLGPGIRTLIIYPMNALVNDQIRRLREIFESAQDDCTITFGRFTGETKEKYNDALKDYTSREGRNPIKNEKISREEMRNEPPNILITNYAMLEYLLLRPGDNIFFSGDNAKKWQYIVFDEAHTYIGAKGIEVGTLIRRVKATLNNPNVKFMLTSATLGSKGKDDNKDIADFAHLLSGASFDDNSIIRAQTQAPEVGKNAKEIDFSIYTNLADLLRKSASYCKLLEYLKNKNIDIFELDDEKEAFSKTLYYMISNDPFYIKLRKLLLNKTKQLSEISKEMNVSQDEFTDFILVASNAIIDGDKIFEARYHMFLKGIDGVFITLKPSEKLFINKRETYKESAFSQDEYKVFNVSFCSNCNALYLTGYTDGGKFTQKKTYRDDKEPEVYLIMNEGYDVEEYEDIITDEQEEEYIICAKCGAIQRATAIDETGHLKKLCSHSSENYTKLKKVKSKGMELHTCPCCHTFNSQRSIIRPYLIGNEAATAVIATSLYNELPSVKIKETEASLSKNIFSKNNNFSKKFISEEKLSKQFLTFSDNRQAAAFFASYLELTYQNNLIKRICTDLAEKFNKELSEGLKIESFVKELKIKFENTHIYENDEERMAWISLAQELVNYKAKNSLQNLGILWFDIDYQFPKDLPELGLKASEVELLFKILLLDFIKNRAIEIPTSLSETDKMQFTPNGKKEIPCFNIEKTKYSSGWLPSEKFTNKRIDLLNILLPEYEDKIGLLSGIWEEFTKEELIVQNQARNGFTFNFKKAIVRSVDKLYYCPDCKTITPYNLRNICPKCHKQSLKDYDYQKELKNNHYNYVFHNMCMDNLVSKEHTAQLGQDLAYDYQDKFKNKKINVLNCSTTFEMGVDVGSLETVFMRNMPPSPSNYAQRAGRAGRSIESAAYALTFCPNSSHDLNYFKHPTDMINGKINPPSFNLNNEKIVQRHIFASALSFFWQENTEFYTKSIGDFFENNGDLAFKNYLLKKPEKLKEYLFKVVTDPQLRKHFDIENFGWSNLLLKDDKSGIFDIACEKYKDSLKNFEDARKIARESGKDSKAAAIGRSIETLEKPDLIEFFSKNNVIPKYGFPIDTVELINNMNNPDINSLSLSRDLLNAISDYAPESEVVANGKIIKSRYIRKLIGYEWPRYNYIICPECGTLNRTLWTDENINECKQCKSQLPQNIKSNYIIPKFGFITETAEPKSVTVEKPEKTYRGEILYIGNSNKEPKKKLFQINNDLIEVSSNKMDELAVINRSNFFVCERCGYTKIDNESGYKNFIEVKHTPSYDKDKICNNKLSRHDLGHEFQTDVVLLKILTREISNKDVAWSVLYSLLEGLSKYLPVARTELSGCLYWYQDIQFSKAGSYQFVLFDNTPGGAGYVRQLIKPEKLKGMLQKGYNVVKHCTCGGDEGNTACYGCLCNFYNQKQHDILQRKYAIDFYENMGINNEFEVVEVENVQEKELNAKFNNDGQDQREKSYQEIWDYIQQDTHDEDEIQLFKELKEYKQLDNCEKPYYSASITLKDTKEKISADLIWPKANVLFFLKDSDAEYQKAKQTNWHCFCLSDNFSKNTFLNLIEAK